mgnify:CR=1 FL=1
MSETMENTLSRSELLRYSRHMAMPEFGIEGQQKLKNSRVLVIGCGGLGAPLLHYLAAAGVGTIGILDFDEVEDSNLQRQVLFGTDDIGQPKVEVAKEKLLKLNPHIEIQTHHTQLTSENALETLKNYDVIADGTDNFPTRYLVNDACVMLNKVNVYGSIFRFEGQVSVFNYIDENGNAGPNYRDLFPTPPPPGMVPSCAEGGVLGVLPGIVGSLQVNEIIKVLTGVGEPLSGKLVRFDALKFEFRTFNVKKDKNNPVNGENPTIHELIDYEAFCGLNGQQSQNGEVKEVSVSEYKDMVDRNEDHQLIDVREEYEYYITNIGGKLIPLDRIREFANEIDPDRKTVVHCRSGGRSRKAILKLQEEHGFNNLYNLKGGILAWADNIDNSVIKY